MPRALVFVPVALLLSLQLNACAGTVADATLDNSQRRTIADSLAARVRAAYDLSQGEPVQGFLSLYPQRGPVVSATAGRITHSRDSLATAINAFWTGVGQYMIDPTWTWTLLDVDVLTSNVAVMTSQYVVPHHTDRGDPHVIGGVWTAVWRRTDKGWFITHEHLSDLPRAAAEQLEARMSPRDSTVAPTHDGH